MTGTGAELADLTPQGKPPVSCWSRAGMQRERWRVDGANAAAEWRRCSSASQAPWGRTSSASCALIRAIHFNEE